MNKLNTNYILFDATRLQQQMHQAKEFSIIHFSLYKDRPEEKLSEVGPFLFSYKSNSDFSRFYQDKGWGNSWGVFFKSDDSFEELFKHFQKFLLVKTEEGEELYFRFYDPRVLRIFLPTCDKQQILEFFGPVDYFITEAENKEEAIVFKHKNGELIQERIPASRVFGDVAEKVTNNTEEVTILPEEVKKPHRRFIY